MNEMNELHPSNCQPSHCQPSHCQTVEPLLSAYLLDELEAGEKANVINHLTACVSCRDELEMLRATAELVAKTSPQGLSLSDDGRAKLVTTAKTAREPRRPVFAYVAAALAAAAVVAVAVSPFWNAPVTNAPVDLAAMQPAIAPASSRPGDPSKEPAGKPVDLAGRPVELASQPAALASKPVELAMLPPSAPESGSLAPVEFRAQFAPRHLNYLKEGLDAKAQTGPAGEADVALRRLPQPTSAAAPAKLDGPRPRFVEGEALRETLGQRQTEYSALRTAAPRDAYDPTIKREVTKLAKESKPEAPPGITFDLGFRKNAGLADLDAERGFSSGLGGGIPDPDAAGTKIAPGFEWKEETASAARRKVAANGLGGVNTRRTVDEALVKERDLLALNEVEARDKRDRLLALKRGAQVGADGVADKPNAPAAIEAAAQQKSAEPSAASAEHSPAPAEKKPAAPARPTVAAGVVEPAEAARPGDGARGGGVAPGGLVVPGAGPATSPAALPPPVLPVLSPPVDEKGAPAKQLAGESKTGAWKLQVDDILTSLDRRSGETPNMMLFRFWGDNPFVEASADSLSTFGADVDTASYSLFRSYLSQQGVLPPKEAVRTEEFVNYFRGRYAPPTEEGRAFAVHTDCAPSPFAHEPDYKLLRVGIKGREVSREKRKACSLVFVIDTSGSMRQGNRLETVKAALRLLVNELDEGDTIGVVAFDFEARVVIEPTPASAKERILDAISQLEPRRNTNVAAGLALGYSLAASRFIKDGANRVILLSDGVANTGVTDVQTMLAQVQTERQKGIYLTTVGVGMGNLNDALLSELADKGNGQCVYVDRVEEAKKVFVDNLTGTLQAIARDMKVQVEFDASKVLRYRLLGYEKRAIADADFRNNAVDAGEIGAGHEVTALYELKLRPEATGAFAIVRVRHLTIEHGEAQELATPVEVASIKAAFADGSPRYRLHACAAELAEVLRESYWSRGGSLERVAGLLKEQMDLREREGGPTLGEDPDVVELLALVHRADALVRKRLAEQTDVARTLETLKDNIYLSARVEDELQRRQDQSRTQLDEIRRRNEELRRQLDSLLAQ